VNIVRRLRKHNHSPWEPMVTLFTDLHTKEKYTNLPRVLMEVKRLKLKNALPSMFGADKWLSKALGLHKYEKQFNKVPIKKYCVFEHTFLFQI